LNSIIKDIGYTRTHRVSLARILNVGGYEIK
jgi:hypothetical protein